MTTYTVTAERSGGWWALSADVPGAIVHSQVRRLEQAEAMARVAISLPTDEPEDTVTITLVVELDEQLREQIAAAAKQAAAARAAQEAASTASRNVGNAMHDRGLSVRDVGRILSLSPQRVSQLASTTSAAAHH